MKAVCERMVTKREIESRDRMVLNLKSHDLFELKELSAKLFPDLSYADTMNIFSDEAAEDERTMAEYIVLVKQSYDRVFPLFDEAAFFFFKNLFEFDPYLSSHFTSSAKGQREKLYDILRFAADNIDRHNELITGLEEMIRRDCSCDITNIDFEAIGDAWLMTLYQMFGKDFSAETRKAWIAYFEWLSAQISVE